MYLCIPIKKIHPGFPDVSFFKYDLLRERLLLSVPVLSVCAHPPHSPLSLSLLSLSLSPSLSLSLSLALSLFSLFSLLLRDPSENSSAIARSPRTAAGWAKPL